MARTQAPPDDGCPLSQEDCALVEQGLQQLQKPMRTIDWCKRVGIPVDAAAQECADLERFFRAVLANSKGQQGSITGAP